MTKYQQSARQDRKGSKQHTKLNHSEKTCQIHMDAIPNLAQ